jgi:hypothetical protein
METRFYRPRLYWLGRIVWGFMMYQLIVIISLLINSLIVNPTLWASIALVSFLFVIPLLLFFLYSAPKVGINDQEIMVQILWFFIKIPWEKVISIDEEKKYFNRWWFVKTDALPFYFVFYSAIIRWKFERGLIINPGKNVDELIAFIEGKIL